MTKDEHIISNGLYFFHFKYVHEILLLSFYFLYRVSHSKFAFMIKTVFPVCNISARNKTDNIKTNA